MIVSLIFGINCSAQARKKDVRASRTGCPIGRFKPIEVQLATPLYERRVCEFHQLIVPQHV